MQRYPTPELAVFTTVNVTKMLLADAYDAPGEIGDDSPAAEAMIRARRHPAAHEIEHAYLDLIAREIDAIDRIDAIAAAHPAWRWDLAAYERALVRILRQTFGEQHVNVAQVPWMMSWGPATGAAQAWIVTLVFEELGRLS